MSTCPCVPQPERPRCYDDPISFTLEKEPDSSASWTHAIFVVHGIGAHEAGVTAVGLRSGFEDAADRLRKKSGTGWGKMPPSYIKEGYWGDYGNFADNFPELWKQMTKPSRKYFKQLWTRRTESYVRTALWYAGQSARLPWKALTYWKDVPKGFASKFKEFFYRFLFRLPLYLVVIFVSWTTLIALLLWPRGRKILSTVLGDVRLYVAPRGPVEQAIRQNIDRRVRDLFLQMLGLGVDKNSKEFVDLQEALPCDDDTEGRKLLQIGSKKAHKFERITWVSHSLGTVVSFNVIGDLLCKCEAIRKEKGKSTPPQVKQVEDGLYRFYTLGSPLRKITWLFPNVTRPWPEKYLKEYVLNDPGKNLTEQNPWWVNFRHIWDPVSGAVSRSWLFHEARECHSPQILTLPGVAHVGYWHTNPIAKYILAQANPGIPGRDSVRLPRWPQNFIPKVLWQLSMIFALAVVCALEFHAAQLAIGYLVGKLSPWWNWLVGVPVLGAILQYFACLLAKAVCLLVTACTYVWGLLSCGLQHFFGWIVKIGHEWCS